MTRWIFSLGLVALFTSCNVSSFAPMRSYIISHGEKELPAKERLNDKADRK